jgi:acyl-CoA thioester hydrolase
MQEAAMDASAAAGYDIPRYESMGRQWLIHETDISYLRPLTYGDSVIVKTWVADFRRVRSRRVYELRHAETGEPVAEAHTDWVYLDTTTARPVTIPPEMITAFYPEGLPDKPVSRESFPEPPLPPPGQFKMRRLVEWRDIDLAQHVNNATYMTYFEDCAIRDAMTRGWPMARMTEAGFGIIARRYGIEYKLPALMGDELEVATWISNVKRSTAVRHFTITRVQDHMLLARAYALWVWVDLVTGRPIRIDPTFVADFASNVVG